MSRAKPGIDPRFDPRFQRGYVPDAAAGDPPEDPAEDPRVVAAPPTRVPTDAQARVPAAGVEGQAAVTLAGLARRELEPPADDGPVDGAVTGASPADGSEAMDDLFEPLGSEAPRFTAWFVAGWGVSVVAAVVGVSTWWASIMSQDYYNGPDSRSDRWLQAFGWMVAPSLVEAGLLGLVAMLVWTGLRHAHRHEEAT